MSNKCACKIKKFGEYACRSSNNAKKCDGKFYKCSDLNSKKYYQKAIEHFKIIEQEMTSLKEENARENFDDLEYRELCDGALLKTDRSTKEKSKENFNEDFICRCYYLNYTGQCERNCSRRFLKPSGDYQIIDYQIPPLNGNCGKVDLVIRDQNNLYLTEVKPPVRNEETLLRMICEILTHISTLKNNTNFHTYIRRRHNMCVDKNNVFPAIMFFLGSEQEREYQNCREEIIDIMARHKIKVFVCDKNSKAIMEKN